MKKLALVLAVVGFAAVSCKKEYTCECVAKVNGVEFGRTSATAEMKKKDAESWCEGYNATSSSGGFTSETTCTLK